MMTPAIDLLRDRIARTLYERDALQVRETPDAPPLYWANARPRSRSLYIAEADAVIENLGLNAYESEGWVEIDGGYDHSTPMTDGDA